jgi:hypothetical protein
VSRRVLIALIALCVAVPSFAFDMPLIHVKKKFAAAGGDECAGYLICQNFEGTGYDHSETWTPGGTPDPDYTGVILRGTQSLRLPASASATGPTFAGQDTIWAFVRFRIVTWAADTGILYLDAANVIKTGATNTLRYTHGADTSNFSGTYAINNNYCMWVQWTKGASGIEKAYIDLCSNTCSGGSCTRPVSTAISNTAGASTAQVTFVKSLTPPSSEIVVDEILISGSEITTVPN